MAEQTGIRPQAGPQGGFLSTPADIALYGGAAGGGKTWALLLEPLRHIHNPDFGAVIFRRTYPQIRSEGGLWSESERNRSTCGVRPYIRATTNPDADSWVADLIAWWIDQESGYPIPEHSGAIRWFVRDGDKLIWFNRQDQAQEQYPAIPPTSFTFIAAKLDDNPALEEADPQYRARLMALPLVEREQLLAGNWKIKPAAGKVFNRGWFEIVEALPAGGLECDGWDFAATEKKQKGDDPDFTAGVGVRKVQGVWYVTWMQAQRVANSDPLLRNLSAQHRARCAESGTQYKVRWEIEPAASGVKENRRLVGMMAGYDAKGQRPGGDKLTRSRALAVQAETGNVKLLRGAWNEEFLKHMHAIPDGDHDDIHDAAALAFNGTNEATWKARSKQG